MEITSGSFDKTLLGESLGGRGGGGVLEVQSAFWGPPNFIKGENTLRMRT